MIIVLCLDNNNGMLFNNRRQSRDSKVIDDLIDYADGRKILINNFSSDLFSDNVYIDDGFLDIAKNKDICFVENKEIEEYLSQCTKLIIYRWNKCYPFDFSFNVDVINSDFLIDSTKDFVGTSHEKITRDIYINVKAE